MSVASLVGEGGGMVCDALCVVCVCDAAVNCPSAVNWVGPGS